MIIVVFLITVLIVAAIQWYIQRQKFYKFADNIPSAKNYGILGHGPHFLGKDDEGVSVCALNKQEIDLSLC
jgi:hypothetical protein